MLVYLIMAKAKSKFKNNLAMRLKRKREAKAASEGSAGNNLLVKDITKIAGVKRDSPAETDKPFTSIIRAESTNTAARRRRLESNVSVTL